MTKVFDFRYPPVPARTLSELVTWSLAALHKGARHQHPVAWNLYDTNMIEGNQQPECPLVVTCLLQVADLSKDKTRAQMACMTACAVHTVT